MMTVVQMLFMDAFVAKEALLKRQSGKKPAFEIGGCLFFFKIVHAFGAANN